MDIVTLKFDYNQNAAKGLSRRARVAKVLRGWILTGRLPAGFKLPSSRELAVLLKLSRETVELAYDQMVSEGYTYREIGRGTFVANIKLPKQIQANTEIEHFPQLEELSSRGQTKVLASSQPLHTAGIFAAGVPDVKSFPASLWGQLYNQSIHRFGYLPLEIGSPSGCELLKKSIAQHVSLQRGVVCQSDQILILNSTQQALHLVASMLLNPGDSAFVENPCYSGASNAFRAAEVRLIPVDVDEQGVQVEKILNTPDKAKLVYVTPSHQYPLGVSLSLERKLALLDWAARNNSWIVEDDYDSEFHYEGEVTPSIQGIDLNNRTIYIGTFSKTMFPGIRLAYLILPPTLIKSFAEARSWMEGYSSQLTQLTMARFIDEGHYSKHVRRMRKLYAARREGFKAAFNEYLGSKATMLHSAGGLQVICNLEGMELEQRVVRAASIIGIELLSLSYLYLTAKKKYGLIMGFSCSTPSEISVGMMHLSKIFQDL